MSQFFGISGVCNVLGAIKTAKFYRFGPDDVIVTICTDAIDRYHSVMEWLDQTEGEMDEALAVGRMESTFYGQKLDYVLEGSHSVRERWHKQGKTVDELDAQRDPNWWIEHQEMVAEIDERIKATR